MTELRLAPRHEIRVRAPGRVSLSLRVGCRGPDGRHPLGTVVQAISVYEDVIATADELMRVTITGPHADQVPTDAGELALRAARALADYTGIDEGVHLLLTRTMPVGGGMAGGSADAAATLVACDALWSTGLSRDELINLATGIGADVPFALSGHTALGVDHSDLLSPALSRGEYHWALGVSAVGLTSSAVLAEFDNLAPSSGAPDPGREAPLLQALRAGDAPAVGELLHNDLQDAVLELRPDLVEALAVAQDAGALGVVLLGSGPTVAALTRSRQHALAVAAAMTAAGVVHSVLTAVGPVPGARVMQTAGSH